MPWYHAVVESQHEIQNPTSAEKIRLLGKRLGVQDGSRVLDVGSGSAGPAIILASTYGCRVTCVESSDEFHSAAVDRVRAAGLESHIELIHQDASEVSTTSDGYDAAICLGATFIWSGLVGTLQTLRPAVRPAGYVAVGEPYWRTWPIPDGAASGWRDEYVTLPETIRRLSDHGFAPVSLIASSVDDWDRYESLHWLTGESWLDEHADDADAGDIRRELHAWRDAYLAWQRDLLGWAIIVGRKT